MNDPVQADLLKSESASLPDTLSVGNALRAMREARGVSLAEVSARIKYSPVQLGHLEAENWSRLPQGLPLRGLVRNYTRYLEGDVDAILALLDAAGGSAPVAASVSHARAQRELQHHDLPPGREPAHRTWAWVLLILILLGVAGAYAINRGWVPEDWLLFDWLKALRP